MSSGWSYVPPVPVPVLHIFGNRSGISHLLQAPSANPNESAITTDHTFRMRATPAKTQYDKSLQRLRAKRWRSG